MKNRGRPSGSEKAAKNKTEKRKGISANYQ